MSPAERRDFRAYLVRLTEQSTDHRRATLAEHLVRGLESFELAAREVREDDQIARAGLMQARLEAYRVARSIVAVLDSQDARKATPAAQTAGTPGAQRAAVKP